MGKYQTVEPNAVIVTDVSFFYFLVLKHLFFADSDLMNILSTMYLTFVVP